MSFRNAIVWLICATCVAHAIAVRAQATDAGQGGGAPTVGEAATSSPAHDPRIAAPGAEAAQTSLRRIQDIFQREYAAAVSPAKKAALAKQLAAQVSATNDAAERWVLLSESLRLAIEGGDAATALPIIDRIPREFSVESNACRLEALIRLAQRVSGPELDDVTKAIVDLAQDVDVAKDDDLPSKAIGLAVGLARKTRNQVLLGQAIRVQQSVQEQQKLAKEIDTLLEKASQEPSDGEASQAVGLSLCLKAGRWKEGLPWLAKGKDDKLATLAKLELSSQRAASDIVRLADGWWDWATSQKPALKEGAMRHAADLYQTVLQDLSGLNKVRVEKRLQEAVLGVAGSEQAAFLADLKEATVTGAKYGFSKDGQYMGKPFTCLREKWPKAIAAIADGSAPAVVQYQLSANVSRIQGRVGVFSPSDAKPDQQPGAPLVFELVADGQVVWKSEPMTTRDTSQPFRVNLRGATNIELRTQTKSGYCAWGAWLDPQVVR